MVIPPLILVRLQKSRLLRGKSKTVETLTNIGLIFVTSLAVLPFALAIFPQRETVLANRLEEKFHHLKDEKGNKISELEFNRGI